MTDKNRKTKVPKLIAQEVACIEKDGFTGNLGQCEGHPHLETLSKKLGKDQVQKTPAPNSVSLSTDMSAITSPLTVSVSSKEKVVSSKLELFLQSRGITSGEDIEKENTSPEKRSAVETSFCCRAVIEAQSLSDHCVLVASAHRQLKKP